MITTNSQETSRICPQSTIHRNQRQHYTQDDIFSTSKALHGSQSHFQSPNKSGYAARHDHFKMTAVNDRRRLLPPLICNFISNRYDAIVKKKLACVFVSTHLRQYLQLENLHFWPCFTSPRTAVGTRMASRHVHNASLVTSYFYLVAFFGNE